MTPANLIQATQGQTVSGLTIVHQTLDAVRKMMVYLDGKGTMVVGFGGTLPTWQDVALDLAAWKTPWEIYKAHAGAAAEVQSLLPDLVALISIHSPLRIVLAGHSQGGARAVLAFISLIVNGSGFLFEVVTFGALPALSLLSASALGLGVTNHPELVTVTNYMLSGDPMGYAPWWLIGLGFPGHVIKLEPRLCWPNPARHDPVAYRMALETYGRL